MEIIVIGTWMLVNYYAQLRRLELSMIKEKG